MRLFLRLAWRNVWRHRRRTLIVVLAIGFTTAMMMLYDGLVAGFESGIYANAIKVLGGNIQVHANGYSEKADQNPLLPLDNDQAIVQAALAQPQVAAASLRISTSGLATNREGAFGLTIIGFEPEKELPVNLIEQHVAAGRLLTATDQDLVFIGKGLADAMGVAVGDRITLAGRATHKQMRSRTMTVAGVYDVGMADIEKTSVYMTLGEAQSLYGLDGQATEIVIYLKQIGDEKAVMQRLSPTLAGAESISWQTSFPDLQNAISRKSSVMNVFSVIILGIVGIGILNLLLMAVYERTREIGLLGALGLKPAQISNLFLLEGGMLGVIGVAMGVVMGLAFNYLLGRTGIDYSQFSGMTTYMALITGKVYPTLGLEQLPLRIISAVVISVLAAYYPAREAAHKEPAEALHFV